MSRRKTGENATVALFPFLAVLMSTMGSLILLLVLISRQARTQVEEQRKAEAAQAADETAIAQQRDDLEWANEQLGASRDKTAAELANLRAQLAHIEEHSDRLRRQIAESQAALKLLESQTAFDEATKAARKVDLEELRRKIAEKEAELREAEKAGLRPQAYAIVPFEGSGGTRRRPIYIECRADRIVLQPEGIEFREEDFYDGQGPANPVAACIRAAAEYAVRMNPAAAGEQPYPLLLVRPDGVPAYYAARSAMSTWDEEFGYELIEAGWPLEFPPADPQLAQLLARTADDARIRQARLAKAAPSIRNAPSNATYGVSRSGHGIERLDGGGSGGLAGVGAARGGGLGDTDGRRGTSGGLLGTSGARGTGGDGIGGDGSGSSGRDGDAFVGGSPGGGRESGGSLPAGGTAFGGAAPGNAYTGGPSLGAPGGTSSANASGGTGGPHSTASRGTGTGMSSGRGSGSGTGDGSGNGGSAGNRYARGPGSADQPGRPNGNGGGSGSRAGGTGGGSGGSQFASGSGSGSSGDGSPFGGSMGGGSAGSAGSAGGSAGQESALQQASAAPNMSMVSQNDTRPESLAGTRGADWGLPQKGANATGLTRPIQVYCSNDRIIVFTERGGDKPIVVEGRTEEAVDELVDDIWSQVRSWGSAGRNCYWKPQLTMHVAPDGERRFAELQALLEGSGLDVVAKPIVLAAPQPTDRLPR